METGGIFLRIAITGVPGTGKTRLCRRLSEEGYQILDMNVVAQDLGCIEEQVVDIDCMNSKLETEGTIIMDSHYSHLLYPWCVIYMECEQDELEKRLNARGYSPEKIGQNMDSILSGDILYQCMESIPVSRILRIDTTGDHMEKNLKAALFFIKKMESNFNGP